MDLHARSVWHRRPRSQCRIVYLESSKQQDAKYGMNILRVQGRPKDRRTEGTFQKYGVLPPRLLLDSVIVEVIAIQLRELGPSGFRSGYRPSVALPTLNFWHTDGPTGTHAAKCRKSRTTLPFSSDSLSTGETLLTLHRRVFIQPDTHLLLML
jgi:hypothetical protein